MFRRTLINAYGQGVVPFANHSIDSHRWQHFRVRENDIVLASWAKSGTTWLQKIVSELILGNSDEMPLMDISPWLDHRLAPLGDVISRLEMQDHRRFIKTHLPADSLPYSPTVRYVYVCRDGRDAFLSWYSYHKKLAPLAIRILNSIPGRVGPPLDPPLSNPRDAFRRWLVDDGYPLWPYFSHIKSWWGIRDLPNVILVHFENLTKNLRAEVLRIADFLGIEPDLEKMRSLLERCAFANMKRRSDSLSTSLTSALIGGSRSFFDRGGCAYWKTELTVEDIKTYERHALAILGPDCARWLGTGEK